MALSDLSVFSEFVYSAQTEVLRQQIQLFNAASQGTIVLRQAAHLGDYSDQIYWAKVAGLVRRRNSYGSGAVTPKKLAQLLDTMVKISAGTPPVEINPGQFKWIQQQPEIAGAVIGQQLAIDTMADMLNTSFLATGAALANVAAVFNDISGAGVMTIAGFNSTQAKFGDRYQDLLVWVMHSKPLFDVYSAAITNTAVLFNFGTINIRSDPFGRIFLVSDSAALITAGPKYRSLGLAAGAIQVDENNEFTDNVTTLNGDENILRSYQAEWTYNLGVKGFQWDKTNGGHSPNDAAIGTGTNWDKIATDNKDLAGVCVLTT